MLALRGLMPVADDLDCVLVYSGHEGILMQPLSALGYDQPCSAGPETSCSQLMLMNNTLCMLQKQTCVQHQLRLGHSPSDIIGMHFAEVPVNKHRARAMLKRVIFPTLCQCCHHHFQQLHALTICTPLLGWLSCQAPDSRYMGAYFCNQYGNEDMSGHTDAPDLLLNGLQGLFSADQRHRQ